MNAQKIKIQEYNQKLATLTLSPLQVAELIEVKKTTLFQRMLSSLMEKFKSHRNSDLSLDEWRRLEYRNEWQEPKSHSIKFLF